MDKERIDNLLTMLGFADSRTKAQAMVMAGVVLVDEKRVEKSSERFNKSATIRIKGASDVLRYVGRGGLKLEAALEHFNIDPSGMRCIDVGSSTGGFTDCLLKKGAVSVAAVDSGTNQLDWRIRNDDRVDVRENVNARFLTPDDFEDLFDLAVMDVSFISAAKLLPVVASLLLPGARFIILIKPQFEVGRGEVGKGGIVRDPEKHTRVVAEVNAAAVSNGFEVIGVIDSPILGAEGNKEFLGAYAKR